MRANVLDFVIPDDVTVAFLFNPFTEDVFATVISRLFDSLDRNPRRLRIIYGNPREEAALLTTGRVRLIRVLRGWRQAANGPCPTPTGCTRPGSEPHRKKEERLLASIVVMLPLDAGASRDVLDPLRSCLLGQSGAPQWAG